MPRFLTPDDAAKVIKVDPRTLVKWARQGYVPSHPLGEGKRRLWRFFEDELLEWVEAQDARRKRA